MEERYWQLRKDCEQAFGRWIVNKRESDFQTFKEALSVYQDFCVDVLEKLIDENADILKNLKD